MATLTETPSSSFTEAVDDFSLRRVPPTARQNTWDIALVRMGLTVSASDLVFGYTIGLYFSFWNAILIALGYSVIVAIASILIGLIGQREGTSFALSSRYAFGREGSRLPSIILALVIAGFYGYILGITVDVQESWQESLEGERLTEPERHTSTWLELQQHAAFPTATTMRDEDEIEILGRRLRCLRYTRVDDDGTWHFWFAHELPGAPVRFEQYVDGHRIFLPLCSSGHTMRGDQ